MNAIQGENSPIHQTQFRTYRKRWLILILYCLYAICCSVHWIQYSAIANVVAKYYSVSLQAVNGTSMLSSFITVIFCIPGSYVLDKMGLRSSLLIGIVGCFVGSWIKVIAINPNRFWLVLLSQCFIAIFQVLLMPIPPKLAAVWFGADEVSFACTLGVIAIQISSAVAFILPSLFVEQGDIEIIQTGFHHMAYAIAIFTTITAVVLFFFFDDAPPTVPSAAQLLMQEIKKVSFNYKRTLKSLLNNASFVFLLLGYGLNGGGSTAIPVLLNQLILAHYPNAYQDVGILGFAMVFCGMIGTLIYGVLLSKFGGLKVITLCVYLACTVATFMFLFLLGEGLVIVFILGITMSIFWCITFCCGFEIGAEITYPEPEAASGGLLINFYQLCGIIITYVFSFVRNEFGEVIGNITLIAILLLADVFLFFIKFDLKRSAVDPPKRITSGYNRVSHLCALSSNNKKNISDQKNADSYQSQ